MDIKEQTTQKRKARGDHSLAWEARAGDARNLWTRRTIGWVDVAGDRVADWRAYWKAPEWFARARDAQTAWSIAATVARIAAMAGLAVFGLVVLIGMIRSGAVRWKPVDGDRRGGGGVNEHCGSTAAKRAIDAELCDVDSLADVPDWRVCHFRRRPRCSASSSSRARRRW